MLWKRKNNDSHSHHKKKYFFSVHKINGPVPWPFYGVRAANYIGSHQKFSHKFGNKKNTSHYSSKTFQSSWFHQMVESFFPQNTWAFLVAAVASASITNGFFLCHFKLLWQWYSGSIMLYACFFLLVDLSAFSLSSSCSLLLFILHILYHIPHIRQNSPLFP